MHEKISNTRSDFLHKLSKQLVGVYSVVALEKLSSKRMSEQNFGKQINDAGWNAFANMLCYKAEEAGCKVVLVNPENTTKTCSNCNLIQSMPLQERTYECPACGLVIDRDLNAARNILVKATVGTTESNVSRDEATASSMKEDATPFKEW
ncbi:IS200/IS605 family element transposase accessory protein TnpB [Candidatus Micrarchaeota archaeon]|nr:IS200/IS605 family element transposase accessory protein TnpB [Candidatus Micrarchaeota archaeon]